MFLLVKIFSRESNSTFTNVCPFVRLSVRKQNPSTAWNHHLSSLNLHPSASFIILHSSFKFFIHPSFISRLLSFSACFIYFYKSCLKLSKSLYFSAPTVPLLCLVFCSVFWVYAHLPLILASSGLKSTSTIYTEW